MTMQTKPHPFFFLNLFSFFRSSFPKNHYQRLDHSDGERWGSFQSMRGDIMLMDLAPLHSHIFSPRNMEAVEHISLLAHKVYDEDATELDAESIDVIGMEYTRKGSRRWSVRCEAQVDEDGDEVEAMEWFATAKGF